MAHRAVTRADTLPARRSIARRVAIIGVSRDPKHFSQAVAREFVAQGYDVAVVNPAEETIGSFQSFPRISDVNPTVDAALILTPPAITAPVLAEVIAANVGNIWIYRRMNVPGADGVIAACEGANVNVIQGECPLMFLPNGSFIHRFHAGLRKLTLSYPH